MRVQYVNGYKIRQELDVDFSILHFRHTNPAMGDSKWYIPAGEIWLDYRFKDEEKFLVEMETEPMTDYSRDAYKKRYAQPGNLVDLIIQEDIKTGLKRQLIDGAQVRQRLDPQFGIGGHDLVYSYIPARTIWLEKNLDPLDLPHVLEHETVERRLMKQGKSYDDAHGWATAAEKESRRAAGGCYIGDACHSRVLDLKQFYVDKTSP